MIADEGNLPTKGCKYWPFVFGVILRKGTVCDIEACSKMLKVGVLAYDTLRRYARYVTSFSCD